MKELDLNLHRKMQIKIMNKDFCVSVFDEFNSIYNIVRKYFKNINPVNINYHTNINGIKVIICDLSCPLHLEININKLENE